MPNIGHRIGLLRAKLQWLQGCGKSQQLATTPGQKIPFSLETTWFKLLAAERAKSSSAGNCPPHACYSTVAAVQEVEEERGELQVMEM